MRGFVVHVLALELHPFLISYRLDLHRRNGVEVRVLILHYLP